MSRVAFLALLTLLAVALAVLAWGYVTTATTPL